MTREEEINQAEQNYLVNTPISDWFSASGKSFRNGILWADQHPRKGLWDSEKVVEWIKNNFSCSGHRFPLHYSHVSYQPEDIIRDLRKAMED